jgi:acetylornithine deacetylase/succinyl-diaminopimelate desuccinylase-like protein
MATAVPQDPGVGDQALALLQDLLRIDTTNPPGAEAAAAQLLADRLSRDGVSSELLAPAAGRANLVARLPGDGSAGGPLLLTGHLDVVPAEPTEWRHPPFEGHVEGGWLYGRGALDMKNHVAACAAVVAGLRRAGLTLKRDVLFAAVADEETGCELGSRFLVERHPEKVRAEWALGEAGGFTFRMGKKRLYPIQVAQKGASWLQMTARGPSGHGSIPREENANLKLARALMRLGNRPLPARVTPAAKRVLRAFGAALGFPSSLGLRLMERPALTDALLESLVPDPKARRLLSAMLHNTVSPVGLRAGHSPNVIPSEAVASLDGRFLPGQTSSDLLRELAEVVGDPAITFEVHQELAPVEAPADTPLFSLLCDALRAVDSEAIPFPSLVPGFTDASQFARLGTTYYGFTPVVFPPESTAAFADLVHGRDERIPVEGFKLGVRALWEVVVRFCS